MPAPAVKPEVPPSELTDRTEGWGSVGMVFGYPEHGDDGVWPLNVERIGDFSKWPSEVSDRDWSHIME